ncbi:MAG: PAS domain S-box protein, partial [Methanobacteriota archaeon]
IDDDPMLLDIAKQFLEQVGGYTVTTAVSAVDALYRLNNSTFDAIISDYEMEQMDGIELLKQLRAKGNTTPFIIFTGKGREEVVIEALNHGADFYLQKGGQPSSQFAELANQIQYAVSRKRTDTDLLRKNEELHAAYEEIAATEEELRTHLDELTRQDLIRRTTEERLLMAQEIGQTGCWEYDIATGKIWGSAEGFRIYGLTPVAGEINIEKIEACIPERERVHQALVDLIARGQEYNCEFAINPADGSPPKVIHSIARIEKDREGNPLKVMGVIQDISDLKKKEQALKESNTYLENLINSANVPIIVWDPTFRITRFNRAFELLTGRNAEDIIGQPLEILFPPSQIDRSLRLIRTTLDGVRWQTVEIEIQHVNGSIRTIVWNSSTLYSPDGFTPVATIAQGQDITEQKRLEQEKDVALGQIKQNLAQLSILNDEIRNPLTVISLSADTIGDNKIAQQILKQTRQIDEMVRQLDQRWIESEKVLGFLRRHYQLSFEPRKLQQNSEEQDAISLHSTERKATILVQEAQAELYTILDSIDARVYVADIETHELLFMNRKGRSLYGDIGGKKCYETLQQGQNKPCPFCTNSRLVDQNGPTGVYQWEFANQKNGRWYDCRDQAIRWVDGRLVRLEIATDITDRKRTLEELQESEERLRQITETISIVYYVLDRESNQFSYVSPAYETIWKRSRQELNTDPYSFIKAIHPDDRATVQEAIRKEREENVYINMEFRIIQPDGRIRWIHSKNFPVFNKDGVVYRITGFAEDITERKRTEEELQLHSQIVQNMAESVVMITASDGVIVYANPRFEQMFGYEATELTGRNISSVNAPGETSPEIIANEIINSLIQSGSWSGEVQNIRKDGTLFWCHANVSTFHHHMYGEVWISVHEDITQRKQIEKALRTSEARYRQLVEYANDAIGVAQNGMLQLINPRMVELTGYSQEELLSHPFPTFIHPDDRAMVVDMHRRRVAGDNPPPRYSFRLVRKDETITWVEISAVAIEWEGSPATLSFLIDITERKQAEEALRESNQKFRLLTGLTRHDILNQLSTVDLFQNLALQSEDLEKIHEYLSNAQQAGKRIEKTIGFTREYENFGIVSSRWQRLYTLVESAKSEVSLGNVVTENKIPEELEVYVDPIIRKVFTILLENAVRHGKNLTKIQISSSNIDDALIITFEDDGGGISQGEKESIFNHGYGKHTGIGLFLAREILSITGISIRECGIQGKGARFEISVPTGKYQMRGEYGK